MQSPHSSGHRGLPRVPVIPRIQRPNLLPGCAQAQTVSASRAKLSKAVVGRVGRTFELPAAAVSQLQLAYRRKELRPMHAVRDAEDLVDLVAAAQVGGEAEQAGAVEVLLPEGLLVLRQLRHLHHPLRHLSRAKQLLSLKRR